MIMLETSATVFNDCGEATLITHDPCGSALWILLDGRLHRGKHFKETYPLGDPL
jgi:hypothetical protein